MSNFYICSICHETHAGVPLSWGPEFPDAWAALTSEERDRRGEIGSDQCILDDQHFFVRGRIEIPVQDGTDAFAWLVWVEVSRENFLSMGQLWTVDGREKIATPYQGTLANELSPYRQPTLGLAVKLQTRAVGMRPFVEITTDHQLRDQQRDGISLHHVQDIAARLSGKVDS